MRPTPCWNAVRAVVCVACLLAAAMAYGVEPTVGSPSFDESFAAIRALGLRAEGSFAESKAFGYIESALRASGATLATSDFADAKEANSSSRIVEAVIPGTRADELAVLVPVDTWVDSPEPYEGAYGIAAALDEAARLAGRARSGSPCPITVRFVFLGAEKRGRAADGQVASLGTATWLSRQTGESRLAVIYLNLGSEPSRVSLRSAGKGVLSPYWFFEGVRRAAESSGIAFGIEANRFQAYRLGLASDYGPAAPYLEAGIPAIEVRGETGGAASSRSWFDAFIGAFASAESNGFPGTWDRHYFIFQIGRQIIVLNEGTYVAFLVILLAAVASSFLVATMRRRGAMRHLLKRAPSRFIEVFALFIALAIAFVAGKGISGVDAWLLGSADAWRLSPRAFAAARILFSLLLFLALLSFLVEKRILTSNPHFYEFAALLCLSADVLLFSAIDLSASFYFMWALILVEFSLAVRRRWATLAAYVLMYVPLIVIASELAIRPDLSAYEKLIVPDYLGVLSLSALLLPFFVFTASPVLFVARPGAAARKKAVVILGALAIAAEAGALLYAAVSEPLKGRGRGDLQLSETIDQDTGTFDVELGGLRRLGKGSLDREGSRLAYESSGDRAHVRGTDGEKRIRVSETASPFLDRVDENVDIAFSEAPYSVGLSLVSEKDILIYDCSLPYATSVDGKSAEVYAGVNPGSRLRLSLTLPSSFRAKLVVTATYLSHGAPYAVSTGTPEDRGLAVKASFDLGIGGR